MLSLREARAGAAAAAPMLFGVVPFGLVAGAAPVAEGLGGWAAVGLSTVVFAGASQLAIVDVLGDGGSAAVAVLAAWTINLRLILYSASLAPYLAHESTARRLAAAYLLVDQNYALSISRWAQGPSGPAIGAQGPSGPASGEDNGARDRRLSFFLGAGVLLGASWVAATLAGVLVGAAVPDDVPLDFAVPLVFLVLLVPLLTDRPAVVSAAAGGAAAVLAAGLGAGPVATVIGATAGIAAGTLTDVRQPA